MKIHYRQPVSKVHLLAVYHTNACPTQLNQVNFMLRWRIRLHRHDQTELNHLICQEAPTFHIVSIEFFEVAGLHIQVPCVTSFIMTAITQYTAPMQLMLESKEENVLSMPLKPCASQTVFNSAVTYVCAYVSNNWTFAMV